MCFPYAHWPTHEYYQVSYQMVKITECVKLHVCLSTFVKKSNWIFLRNNWVYFSIIYCNFSKFYFILNEIIKISIIIIMIKTTKSWKAPIHKRT